MKTAVILLCLILAGPGLLWLGIHNLRTRAWHDGVPLVEAAIDRAAGVEPPERNDADRRFARFQAWLLTLFGTLFTLLGLVMAVSFWAIDL